MAEQRDRNTAQQQETLTQTENQVSGVLQDYLDQLLIVATERRSTGTRTKAPTEQIAATAEVGGEQKSSLHSAAQESAKPVAEVRLADPASAALTLNTTLNTTLSTLPEEIQDWDPYADEPAVDVSVDIPVDVPVDVSVEESQSLAVSTDISPEEKTKLAWDSAQGVECLIFKVAGLKLAIPLSMLGGVFPSDDKVTSLFGQAEWSMGVWQTDGQKLTVVDSARLIMPERQVSLADEGYEFLIQLDRAPWALACQEIVDTVTLVSESIKWRTDVSRRPWLAGTVISEMCALLDVPGLIELLDSRRSA